MADLFKQLVARSGPIQTRWGHHGYPGGNEETDGGRADAALPQATSVGDAVRPHPVTRNGNRRTRSTWVLARRTVSGSRSASDGRLGHYLRSVGPRGQESHLLFG